jgi:DNA-binding response OmpR family regulator
MKMHSMNQSDAGRGLIADEHVTAMSKWRDLKNAENMQCIVRAACAEPKRVSPLIVVVDDEPVVAITLAEILRRHGANALWFTEPLLALSYFQSNSVDLLVSDINMPLMDGISLAAQLKALQPACKLLLLSAVCDQPEVAARVIAMNLSAQLRAKPLQVACLLSAINELLSELEKDFNLPLVHVAPSLTTTVPSGRPH